jgi:hypothetical protein
VGQCCIASGRRDLLLECPSRSDRGDRIFAGWSDEMESLEPGKRWTTSLSRSAHLAHMSTTASCELAALWGEERRQRFVCYLKSANCGKLSLSKEANLAALSACFALLNHRHLNLVCKHSEMAGQTVEQSRLARSVARSRIRAHSAASSRSCSAFV